MRLRNWIGTAATIISALFEHWLGETMTIAALTAVVVIFGGILWRRVSMLMAAPQANNCTLAYAVQNRLVNYMAIMAPLSPIVTANTPTNTNATFLASLSQAGPQVYSGSGTNTSLDAVHHALVNHNFMASP